MFKFKKISNVDNPDILKKYLDIAKLDTRATFKNLHTGNNGLPNEEIGKRLRENGSNVIINQKKKRWYHFLLKSILDPFIIVLLILAFSTYIIGSSKTDIIGSFIIFMIACISTVIRFSQEYRSHLSSLKLKHLIKTKVNVRRGSSAIKEVDVEKLVIGDIIILSAG